MTRLTVIVDRPINKETKLKFLSSEFDWGLSDKEFLKIYNKEIEFGIPWSNIVVFQIENGEKNQFSSKENT